jgi:hypothetical protein
MMSNRLKMWGTLLVAIACLAFAAYPAVASAGVIWGS